ncbi:glycosyltransferase [Thiospirillum jenense]|uniref:Glycosyltransferase n=2 Tax=Thiospirillum jenense TaxID=1653858 RepID=A0A839HAZ4_9GAMM|nr:glycosyltransferase [Thiospirillum jenense]
MLINLMRGFIEQGVTVELLIMRRDSPHLIELPPAVNLIPLRARHSLLVIPELAHYLRCRRPFALLAVKERAGRAAVIARHVAGIQTPIILRLGTHLSTAIADHSAFYRWVRRAPLRWLYPSLNGIIAVSEGVAADIATLAQLPRQRITVIRNPVITPELKHLAAAPCSHHWLCANDGIPTLVGAGRLQTQKDFPTLIRAIGILRQQRPCRLIILGEGRGRVELKQFIRSLGLEDVVQLPGFYANPYSVLARANAFVLSSRWEGSPNVLTEAMALGTPVVATNCPSGPAELLANGQFGALVPVGDAAALATAIAHTLDHPLPAAQLRAAVSEYTIEMSSARYLALLKNGGVAGD